MHQHDRTHGDDDSTKSSSKQQYDDNRNNQHNEHDESYDDDLAELAELESSIESMKQSKRRAIRAEIEAKRAELSALQNEAPSSDSTQHAATVTPQRAHRAPFTTPFTDGRPDFYKAGIRQPRRQTLSFANHHDDDSSSTQSEQQLHHKSSRPTDVNASLHHRSHDHSLTCTEFSFKPVSIAVPMPKVFDGEEADQSKLRVQLMDFIDDLERYVTYSYASKGQTPSPQEWLSTAACFLKGSAAALYRDQLVIALEAVRLGERESDLTWEDLRSALIDQFGRPLDGYDLILSMFQLKQSTNESIKQFSDRFHAHHMELIRQDLANRDLSSALYLNALKPDIRDHIKEHIATHDFFKVNNIVRTKPRSAIQALQRLAAARESTIRSKQQSSHNGSSTPAIKPTPTAAPQQSVKKGRFQRNVVETIDSVPDALFSARMAAGLCGRCNSSAHKIGTCDQPRNANPIPYNRARSHAMAAEPDSAPAAPAPSAPTAPAPSAAASQKNQ